MRIRLTLLGLVCASWLFAQEAPFFPTPSYFRKITSTPSLRVELQPPVRLADYVLDGKLVLSLRAFLDLVMANNTDIAIQKLTVETSRNGILSAFGSFDPTLNLSLSHGRSASTSDQVIDQVTQLKTLTQSSNLSYSQLLPSGTTVGASMGMTKGTTNSANSTLNPNLGASWSFNFSQPLLRGRSLDIVRLNITTARASLRSTELNLTNQMLSLIQTAESAYWDVVAARENLKVQEQSLALQDESLKRSTRELELGAMAPLDIFQPQAQYAQAQIQVSQAKYNLVRVEDALRRQIGVDLDLNFRTMPIELTEKVEPPSDASAMDREALVQKALANRPDLISSRVGLEVDDLNIKSATNQLRPNLSFTGSYTASGTSGTRYQSAGFGSPLTLLSTGGFGNALDIAFARDNPRYTFGLNLQLPIRDRRGAANLANNLIRKKSDTLSLRRSEQQVRQDVLNAVTSVESSRESVKLAIVSRDLAQKQLDADWQKYNLGTGLMFYVLNSQTLLTNAESNLLNSYITYHRNMLNLYRTTGELLDQRGIVIQ